MNPQIPTRDKKGYYVDPETGLKLKSVTTLLSQGCPKPGLIYWAGNTVAQTAIDNLPYLTKATLKKETRLEAYEWLRRAHTRKKNERGDIGTTVHKIIEAFILDTTLPEIHPEITGYIDQFLLCVKEFDIEFTASEMTVFNYAAGYAGTLDWMANIPGYGHVMGDTKTGKGVYAEAGMQMSAYRNAEMAWLRNGQKVPVPHTDTAVVLHLSENTYELIPVQTNNAVYEKFRTVIDMAEWMNETSKTVVGQKLTPITTHGKAA